MQRKIILGPPGTGKTTKLLDLVNIHLDRGDSPEEIGFISFTKKAVNEARDRAILRFGFDPRRFRYFRTIHSLCFRQLGISRLEVMGQNQYKEIGDMLGLKITGIRRQDQMSYEMERGELCVFLESLARMKCETLKNTWENENVDLDWYTLDLVSRSIKEYKKRHYVIDFTDMLTRYMNYGHVPKLKALFVDEAQDLCRLQWNIINKLSTRADVVYIAGDDDQAIFRWSGADVDYFLDLDGDTDILSQSYRIPRSVYDVSQGLIDRIERRRIKPFKPCNRPGLVEYPVSIEDIPLDAGSWLLLVRNGYQAKSLIDHCRHEGFYYKAFNDAPRRNDVLRAVVAWEDLRAGRSIPGTELNLIRYFMRPQSFNKIFNPYLSVKNDFSLREDVRKDLAIWHEGLDKLNVEDREYLIACLRRGEKLKQEPRIRITTIHGSKGGEASNVALFTDISARTARSMEMRPDDEARVFYVGATRAIDNLYIVQPQTRSFFTI